MLFCWNNRPKIDPLGSVKFMSDYWHRNKGAGRRFLLIFMFILAMTMVVLRVLLYWVTLPFAIVNEKTWDWVY